VKTANISQFKTHISSLLRAVRDGDEIIILDRDIPVARVSPVARHPSRLASRPPVGPIPFRKPDIRVAVDPLQYLTEERTKR
jgi:antitoxin (DNA-binding transcriptional repressor) of toxin-antitoxin stability system